MKAHLIRATAVTMLLVLLGSAAAQAHERTASTSLTLTANKSTVDQGDEVKFRGKLRSDWKECRKSKSVTLYRDGPVGIEAERVETKGELPLLAELRAFVEHLRGGPPPRSSAAEGAAMVSTIAELRALAA